MLASAARGKAPSFTFDLIGCCHVPEFDRVAAELAS